VKSSLISPISVLLNYVRNAFARNFRFDAAERRRRTRPVSEPDTGRTVFFYLQELKKWNRQINLTGSADDLFVVQQHFVDSLSCATSPVLTPTARLLDIGSGAGFPGIPLKIFFPELCLTAVDAVTKKVMFLRQICRSLTLPQVECLAAKLGEPAAAPSLPLASFDVIVSRAVGALPLLLDLALPYLAPGGHCLFQRGQHALQEVEEHADEIKRPGCRVTNVQKISFSFLEHPRYLVTLGFENKA